LATAAEPRRPGVGAAAVVLIAFCILVGLGVWQVKRLKWKTDLLHRIAALQTAPPEPATPVLRRISDGLDVNFVRVQLSCPELELTPTLRVYAVIEGQAGYRFVTACPLASGPYRSLLVDRGFVPLDRADDPLPAGRPLLQLVTGVLRKPDPRSFVTPKNQLQRNLWYWRDIPAMAAALHAARPAPVTLMLESPSAPSGLPRPAPVPLNIPNNHLGYAITWFGLAAALAGVYLAMLFRRRSGSL
jgi:surfeit locus 1 family protein